MPGQSLTPEVIEELFSLVKENPNVIGFSRELEEKMTGEKQTGQDAIVVFVREKKPTSQLSHAERIPRTIHGLPVDVIALGDAKLVGPVLAAHPTPLTTPTSRFRPMIGGISSGTTAADGGTGTLGYFVKDGSHHYYNLSCAHVYGETISNPILQPGPDDNGTVPNDQVGALAKAIYNETVDAACARLDVGLIGAINGTPAPVGIIQATRNMRVRKSGRTTAVTWGEVRFLHIVIRVFNPITGGTHLFTDLIGIRHTDWLQGGYFCRGGDSGSLVVDATSNYATGLLNAHTEAVGMNIETMALACHIDQVLTQLAVVLVAPGERWP